MVTLNMLMAAFGGNKPDVNSALNGSEPVRRYQASDAHFAICTEVSPMPMPVTFFPLTT